MTEAKHTVTFDTITDFSGFNIAGNIWVKKHNWGNVTYCIFNRVDTDVCSKLTSSQNLSDNRKKKEKCQKMSAVTS